MNKLIEKVSKKLFPIDSDGLVWAYFYTLVGPFVIYLIFLLVLDMFNMIDSQIYVDATEEYLYWAVQNISSIALWTYLPGFVITTFFAVCQLQNAKEFSLDSEESKFKFIAITGLIPIFNIVWVPLAIISIVIIYVCLLSFKIGVFIYSNGLSHIKKIILYIASGYRKALERLITNQTKN